MATLGFLHRAKEAAKEAADKAAKKAAKDAGVEAPTTVAGPAEPVVSETVVSEQPVVCTDPPRTPVSANTVSNIAADEDEIIFDVSQVGAPVLVKASYFPNWKVSGGEGPYRVAPNLMVVVPTSQHVRLHYGYIGVDHLSNLASFGGIIALVALFRSRSRSMQPALFDPVERSFRRPERTADGPAAGARRPRSNADGPGDADGPEAESAAAEGVGSNPEQQSNEEPDLKFACRRSAGVRSRFRRYATVGVVATTVDVVGLHPAAKSLRSAYRRRHRGSRGSRCRVGYAAPARDPSQ